jgi:hypothetical protein
MLLLLQFWITFFFFKNEPKSTFGKKTSYFGTLALSSLFHLLKLAQACTSLYKLKKVLCMFTDDGWKGCRWISKRQNRWMVRWMTSSHPALPHIRQPNKVTCCVHVGSATFRRMGANPFLEIAVQKGKA